MDSINIRDEFYNAQAKTKHQSSNNMAKEFVSRIAEVLEKARISEATRILGIFGQRENALIVEIQRVPVGSLSVFPSLLSSMDDFSPDMLCMKRVEADKKALVYRSAARNKERFSCRG